MKFTSVANYNNGSMQTADIIASCHNVLIRDSVPLPAGWFATLKAQELPIHAADCAQVSRKQYGLEHESAECTPLGLAAPYSAHGARSSPTIGDIFMLPSSAGPAEAHILLAHVEGEQWLCHLASAGNFEEQCLVVVVHPHVNRVLKL